MEFVIQVNLEHDTIAERKKKDRKKKIAAY